MYITNCDNFFEPNVFIACAQVLQSIIAIISYALVHCKILINYLEVSKNKKQTKQKRSYYALEPP